MNPLRFDGSTRNIMSELKAFPGVTGVAYGFRYRDGKRTQEVGYVVFVKEKLKGHQLPKDHIIPKVMPGAIPTDVVQQSFDAMILRPMPPRNYIPQEFTRVRRPCEPGNSIGHWNITAGTLGAWVRRGDTIVALTNNHVGANSNDASIGDFWTQAGPYDLSNQGLLRENHRFCRLLEFGKINFPERPISPCLPPTADARAIAAAVLRNANNMFRELGLDVRLVRKQKAEQLLSTGGVAQPDVNLIDASVGVPLLEEWVEPHTIGTHHRWQTVGDFNLGDEVVKTGRTTMTTVGKVVGVGARVSVNYGDAGTAEFEDQVLFEGTNGNLSRGGDSGSAILSSNGVSLNSLLFAGGDNITVGNRAVHVFDLLGLDTKGV